MAGEYRSTIIRNFTSVRYVLRKFPLSQWIIFSPRIVDHVRSKCSSNRMSGIIYTSGRNASGINKRNKGKRREWLVAEMPLFISLWRRGQIPVILSSFYSLFSRNIPPPRNIFNFYHCTLLSSLRISPLKMFLSWKEILVAK